MVRAVVAHDMRVLAKSGAAALLAIVLALLGMAIRVALPESIFENGAMPAVSVALVNPDESNYAGILYRMLEELPEIDYLVQCSPEEAERMLEAGEASIIVFMPEGVVDALIYNRPAEIRIKAKEALAGASGYSMASAAAGAMNAMQTAAYRYEAAARPLFKNEALFYLSYNKFCLEIISDALSRNKLVDAPDGGDGLYAGQLMGLALFFMCAGAAMAVAVLTASQKSAGGLRRLRATGAGFGHLLAGKLAGSLGLALVLGLLSLPLLGALAPGAAWGRFLSSVFLVTAMVTPVFLMVALFASSAPQAALAASALMPLCLFEGGGFYPAYLFGEGALAFNPARLNFMLAGWASGEAFPLAQALACAAAGLFCVGAAALAWRKEAA